MEAIVKEQILKFCKEKINSEDTHYNQKRVFEFLNNNNDLNNKVKYIIKDNKVIVVLNLTIMDKVELEFSKKENSENYDLSNQNHISYRNFLRANIPYQDMLKKNENILDTININFVEEKESKKVYISFEDRFGYSLFIRWFYENFKKEPKIYSYGKEFHYNLPEESKGGTLLLYAFKTMLEDIGVNLKTNIDNDSVLHHYTSKDKFEVNSDSKNYIKDIEKTLKEREGFLITEPYSEDILNNGDKNALYIGNTQPEDSSKSFIPITSFSSKKNIKIVLTSTNKYTIKNGYVYKNDEKLEVYGDKVEYFEVNTRQEINPTPQENNKDLLIKDGEILSFANDSTLKLLEEIKNNSPESIYIFDSKLRGNTATSYNLTYFLSELKKEPSKSKILIISQDPIYNSEKEILPYLKVLDQKLYELIKSFIKTTGYNKDFKNYLLELSLKLFRNNYLLDRNKEELKSFYPELKEKENTEDLKTIKTVKDSTKRVFEYLKNIETNISNSLLEILVQVLSKNPIEMRYIENLISISQKEISKENEDKIKRIFKEMYKIIFETPLTNIVKYTPEGKLVKPGEEITDIDELNVLKIIKDFNKSRNEENEETINKLIQKLKTSKVSNFIKDIKILLKDKKLEEKHVLFKNILSYFKGREFTFSEMIKRKYLNLKSLHLEISKESIPNSLKLISDIKDDKNPFILCSLYNKTLQEMEKKLEGKKTIYVKNITHLQEVLEKGISNDTILLVTYNKINSENLKLEFNGNIILHDHPWNQATIDRVLKTLQGEVTIYEPPILEKPFGDLLSQKSLRIKHILGEKIEENYKVSNTSNKEKSEIEEIFEKTINNMDEKTLSDILERLKNRKNSITTIHEVIDDLNLF